MMLTPAADCRLQNPDPRLQNLGTRARSRGALCFRPAITGRRDHRQMMRAVCHRSSPLVCRHLVGPARSCPRQTPSVSATRKSSTSSATCDSHSCLIVTLTRSRMLQAVSSLALLFLTTDAILPTPLLVKVFHFNKLLSL